MDDNILNNAYGPEDQDVMNFRAGIAGFVFDGWADERIAEMAIEEAKRARTELSDAVKSTMSD